jgi:hypothetical protein
MKPLKASTNAPHSCGLCIQAERCAVESPELRDACLHARDSRAQSAGTLQAVRFSDLTPHTHTDPAQCLAAFTLAGHLSDRRARLPSPGRSVGFVDSLWASRIEKPQWCYHEHSPMHQQRRADGRRPIDGDATRASGGCACALPAWSSSSPGRRSHHDVQVLRQVRSVFSRLILNLRERIPRPNVLT